MVVVFSLCITIMILAVILAALYYFIYRRYVNRRIHEGKTAGQRMTEMPKFMMGVIIAALVLICAVLVYGNSQSKDIVISRNDYAVIDVSEHGNYQYISWSGAGSLEDASFAEMYSIEENPGYKKSVSTDGNFTFTVFTRTAPADAFHPDFLCYVTYTGEKDGLSLGCSAQFTELSSNTSGGNASVGGNLYDCLLFVGNMDTDCVFQFTAAVFDETAEAKYNQALEQALQEDKNDGLEMAQFAVNSGTVMIEIE